jgi:xanthine dehydrogenase YagR molybdenum-binding subunit
MTELLQAVAMGRDLPRVEGVLKVTGKAPYAFEHPVNNAAYVHAVQASIGRGRITAIDTDAAEALDGVLAVLTHENAPRLASTENAELAVLQDGDVGFRGQVVAVVVAETAEIARYAASLVRVIYDQQPHDTRLRADHPDLYAPETVNAGFPTDTEDGDPDAALVAPAALVDEIYTTPMELANPIEPHTTVAVWDPDSASPRLTLYDSTQGVHVVRKQLEPVLGLEPGELRVISPYVGGGFGSKGQPHAHNVVAALAAQAVPGRPVKLALTRQQMFSLSGHRTPTIQRVRLAADDEGTLTTTVFEVVEHTSRIKEFAEQTAVPARMMYASATRRTSHRLAALDVPVPSWVRAPGECPGSFGLEVAMDELAYACGLDPIELRVRNDPEVDPESGRPWSNRRLVECLQDGASRFGWERRDPAPGTRREGDWMVGFGVASATYPAYLHRGSAAAIEHVGSGRYVVRIGAADIGTGTWTALAQIAADALGCPVESVSMEIGDTDLPMATVEGGSAGIASWGSTIVGAARDFRDKYGSEPDDGASVQGEMAPNPDRSLYSMHSFGAQFAEVRVHVDTGEIRVPRMFGLFSVGRVINPRTARSQFIGGMTMGLSMALHEECVLDHTTGHVVNHDFAEYHIATHADVGAIDAAWLDEEDPHANPMGSRGIGEIGIVGAAAAVANAAYHATGVRVRNLPITLDDFL